MHCVLYVCLLIIHVEVVMCWYVLYTDKAGMCQLCNDQCLKCESAPDRCLTCHDGEEMVEHQCLAKCQTNEYRDKNKA